MLKQLSGEEPAAYVTKAWYGSNRNTGCLSVIADHAEALRWVYGLQAKLGPGLVAFAGTRHYASHREGRKGTEVVIGPGSDPFAIVEHAGTDAGNYDMTTEEIIRKLKSFHARYGIRILEASNDTVGFDLLHIPDDLPAFCQELYEFCPDIVDQGVGSLEALEELIGEAGYLILWWD
ncbi:MULTISPECIES: DUF4253 domain-containing protein [Paenibacillus]|uniref:DUF4253 domain-containing protein n=1 Tax=Paenibacillus TaxID=44249 RepID=UPI0022B91FFD|nr:DUF4253 domain-containing protein [Paenibacillus caseinilyticus]MCZ8519212.1 DUF4253 domain-containing protein [Paenibacillus caseinilyticus]